MARPGAALRTGHQPSRAVTAGSARSARVSVRRSEAPRIDTDTAGEPLTLAVITATGYGYVRADGVAVIPIGALTA